MDNSYLLIMKIVCNLLLISASQSYSGQCIEKEFDKIKIYEKTKCPFMHIVRQIIHNCNLKCFGIETNNKKYKIELDALEDKHVKIKGVFEFELLILCRKMNSVVFLVIINHITLVVKLMRKRRNSIFIDKKIRGFKHPNIVEIYTIFHMKMQEGKPIITDILNIEDDDERWDMSSISGEFSWMFMESCIRTEEILGNSAVINISKDIFKALDYLHEKNIIHGFICPESVFGKEQNGKIVHKLIKLHHMCVIDHRRIDLNNIRASTYFLAPEIYRTCTFSEKADVYSAGLLIYFLLIGKEKVAEMAITEYNRICKGCNASDDPTSSLCNRCIYISLCSACRNCEECGNCSACKVCDLCKTCVECNLDPECMKAKKDFFLNQKSSTRKKPIAAIKNIYLNYLINQCLKPVDKRFTIKELIDRLHNFERLIVIKSNENSIPPALQRKILIYSFSI